MVALNRDRQISPTHDGSRAEDPGMRAKSGGGCDSRRPRSFGLYHDYFHTTLELRFLVDDERRADRRGFYLFSITRSRIDGTSGLTGSLLRPVISRRSRYAVRGYLEHLKRQVEVADPAPF
jgi:hypothetical protein